MFWIKLIILCASILGIVLLFNFLTKKFTNPYTFTLTFGRKGSGKSCTMQKDLIKHYKKGWHCFADSNTDLDFVKRIDARNIHNYHFPPKSLVCIDEINLLWDNRDFKNFSPQVQKFFREQRKHKVKVLAYSQTFDCDKKLRDLTDRLAIQRKILRVFSFRRYYYKTVVILSASETRDTAKMTDDYKKQSFIFGGFDFTYIPKYINCYDTNEIHN